MIFIFFLLNSVLFAKDVAKILVEIPSESRFLFGDQIVYKVKIQSLLGFDSVKVMLEGKNKPDYFNYNFSEIKYGDDYKSQGRIIFQYFKTGKLKLPDFYIILLKHTKEGDIKIFKKRFKGLTFSFISVLKGNERISSPVPPLSSIFPIIIVSFLLIIIGLILFIFLIKKRKKREKPKSIPMILSEKIKKLENMKKISLNKNIVFEIGKIVKDSLSILNEQDLNPLTIREIEKDIKEDPDKYELNKIGIELLEKLNLQKFGYNEINEGIIDETLEFLQKIMEEVKNV